jgi:DNA helicase-2/ATP-dependent DNA helicase PcrA
LPSEFIVKLNGDETLIENQQYDATEENLLPIMENKLQPVLLDVARIMEAEKTLLQDILQDFVLSPSTLNQYLRDPHEFLHSTLLRAPKNDDEHGSLAFGNAIHSALEAMYLPLTAGKTMPPLALLQNIFERELRGANLPADVEKSRLQLGLLGLEKYYQNHADETVNVLAVEKNFGNKNVIVIGGVKIKGKIDRLDLLENNQVVVMDYKTGQAKTDGEIMKAGKGASERELQLPVGLQSEYKRQLLFYKILVENNPHNQYRVVMGQLNFPIEYRDKKAVMRKVEFLDEEVAQMHELIKTVDSEIRSLAFLSER